MTEGGRGSGSLSLGLGIDSPQWGLSGGIMLSQPLHNLCQCSAGIKCFCARVCVSVWLPSCRFHPKTSSFFYFCFFCYVHLCLCVCNKCVEEETTLHGLQIWLYILIRWHSCCISPCYPITSVISVSLRVCVCV